MVRRTRPGAPQACANWTGVGGSLLALRDAAMTRLDQIIEYLFTHPGCELALDSNAQGAFRQAGAPDAPVFKQALRTGQILLLFAEVVPKELSQALLAGDPISFRHVVPHGTVQVKMAMAGADIHVVVTAEHGGSAPPPPVTPPGAFVPLSSTSGIVAAPRPPPAEKPVAAAAQVARVPPPSSGDPSLAQVLEVVGQLPERRASHLHLSPQRPPFLRVNERLVAAAGPAKLAPEQIRAVVVSLAPQARRAALADAQRVDFSVEAGDFVLHVRAQEGHDGLAAVIRCLPRAVPAPGSLELPEALTASMPAGGLWVVAGAPGQGLSTTLASLAQSVLDRYALSVCTVESPLEYVLSPGAGVVQQLEVGTHVASVHDALVRALSTSADVVMVSDLDTPQALPAVVALAERGRLVLLGARAGSVVEAAQRLASVADPGVRVAMSGVVRGLFAQQLVPNVSGGRSLAWELLTASEQARLALWEGNAAKLAGARQRTMDESLLELVRRGDVERADALARAADRAWLEQHLARVRAA